MLKSINSYLLNVGIMAALEGKVPVRYWAITNTLSYVYGIVHTVLIVLFIRWMGWM
jgi:hypothetical protein